MTDRHTSVCDKTTLLLPRPLPCNPAAETALPIVCFSKLIPPHVLFSRGVFFSQTKVSTENGMQRDTCHACKHMLPRPSAIPAALHVAACFRQLCVGGREREREREKERERQRERERDREPERQRDRETERERERERERDRETERAAEPTVAERLNSRGAGGNRRQAPPLRSPA